MAKKKHRRTSQWTVRFLFTAKCPYCLDIAVGIGFVEEGSVMSCSCGEDFELKEKDNG